MNYTGTMAEAESEVARPAMPEVGKSVSADVRWMIVALSALAIVPFWTVGYPVITDYPNHLARWFVLFHMKDAAYHFATFYKPAWGPLPYITPDVLAMMLQYLLPIDIVGRCILSLCIILVVFGTYFFLKQACPENVGLASFAILVGFSPSFLMGSISNQFSLAFCLLVVGLWVSYCQAPKRITAAGIAAGLLLVYLSHLSGFVVTGLVMGIYAWFQKERWKKIGTLALLSLPPLVILMRNPNHVGNDAKFQYGEHVIWEKLRHLAFPVRLYTSNKLDLLMVGSLVLLVALALGRKKFAWQPVWVTISAVLLVIYLATPGQYGFGGYVDARFLPFLYLFLLASVRLQRVPRYLQIGLALLVLFRTATVEQMFVSRQPELKQLTASFDAIPRNAKVLPLALWPKHGLVGAGEMHHMEYGVIERGFLDPQLFHLAGVQPIRLAGSPYCANVFCFAADNADQVDWRQIAASYDYLWVVHNDPKIAKFASGIGGAIWSNDAVTVYRVRTPQL